MMKPPANLRAVLVLVLLLAAACNRDMSTAQGVAEEFVDRHYVAMDLQKAKALTVSIALEKVNEQIRLIDGQKIDASTQKPRVNYKLLEKKESEGRASFLFEGTVRSDDNSSFTRQWRITARKEGDDWRVSNFTESD
jgi:predicted small secreted protein